MYIILMWGTSGMFRNDLEYIRKGGVAIDPLDLHMELGMHTHAFHKFLRSFLVLPYKFLPLNLGTSDSCLIFQAILR